MNNIIIILITFIVFFIFYKIEMIMDQVQFEDNKSMRRLVAHKLWFGVGQLLLMALIVIFCAWQGYIEKTITGTLLGSIFGYSFKSVFEKK